MTAFNLACLACKITFLLCQLSVRKNVYYTTITDSWPT